MPSRRSLLQAAVGILALNLDRAKANRRSVWDIDFSVPDADGEQARVFGNALRYADHEVFGDRAGIVIENATENGVEDAGYASVTTLPGGWHFAKPAGNPSDCTYEFTRTGQGTGVLRLSSVRAAKFVLVLGSSQHFPVSAGSVLTGSLAIRSISPLKTEDAEIELLIIQRDANGTPTASQSPAAKIQQLQTDQAWWAQVQATPAADGFASLAIGIAVREACDLKLEINNPQLERQAWRSTFCVAARPKDRPELAADVTSRYLSSGSRGFVITADAPRHGANASLWSEIGDEQNAFELIYKDRMLYARVVSGGVATEIPLGRLPPLMRFSVSATTTNDTLSISLNGKAPKTLDRKSLQTEVIRLGDGSAGSWNATVKRVMIVCDGPLDVVQESRRDVVFYDDFDRPDSRSLGKSPTGQTIERTGAVETAIVSNRWVADTGGMRLDFAAYGKVGIVASFPRYMGAILNWSRGRSGGAAGLIAATNNLLNPTNALHTIVTDRDFIFQTISASSVDPAFATCRHETAMSRNGATLYGVARLFNAQQNAVVFVGPDGEMPRHVSPYYIKSIGNTVVFEHYWQVGQCKPEFSAVAAA